MSIILPGVREAVVNQDASGATPTAATETVLAGSAIVVPSGLSVGDVFEWTLSISKTAAGTGKSQFWIKSNTSETIATGTTDGAATLVELDFDVAETAAVDSAMVDIKMIVEVVDAAVGTVLARLLSTSVTAGGATGFSNQQAAARNVAADTSGDILAVGLSAYTGVADVVTVNLVTAKYYAAGSLSANV